MAKRRKAKTRTIYRSAPKKISRRSKRKSGVGKIVQIDAMLYGAGRGFLSSWVSQIASNIPILNIADEIGIGVANYFIAKNSSGMIKNIAEKGLVYENAQLGATLSKMWLGGASSSSQTQQYLYG